MLLSSIITATTTSRRKEQNFYGDYIFSEPNQKARPGYNWIFNESVYGPWKNWVCSLSRLMQAGKAEYYGVFQDDIVLCSNWKEYLLSIELPPVFSLFTPERYMSRKERGVWLPVYEGKALWMAQALFFRADIATALLKDTEIHNAYGKANIDNRVGDFLERAGIPMHFHNPSLCEHIGEKSTIWSSEATLEGDRAAANFPGEDFDAMSLCHARGISSGVL